MTEKESVDRWMERMRRQEIAKWTRSARSQLGRGYIIAKEEGNKKLAAETLEELEKFDTRHSHSVKESAEKDNISYVVVRWRFECGHMGTRSIPMKSHYMGIATTHVQGCGSPNIYFEYRIDKYEAKDTYGVCEDCGAEWFAGDFDSYK